MRRPTGRAGPARLPELTGLRRARPGHVELEVDGRPWRTVPDDVVVRAGLSAGTLLDRSVLRRLRRELRCAEARALAARALARRDLPARRLRERLERAGVPPTTAKAMVARLAAVGLVNDARLAHARAEALASRGYGDAAIAARLEAEQLPEECVRAALAVLPPESERARGLAAPGQEASAVARRLARRGFAPETVEDVVGLLDADPWPG